jgi:hypothetical protein
MCSVGEELHYMQHRILLAVCSERKFPKPYKFPALFTSEHTEWLFVCLGVQDDPVVWAGENLNPPQAVRNLSFAQLQQIGFLKASSPLKYEISSYSE